MEINEHLESLVREAFVAAVAQEDERFTSAITVLGEEGDQAFVEAIDHTVMTDLHDGPPSEKRLKYLVEVFYQMEDWYRTEGLPVENFLRALSGLPAEPMEPDILGLLAFLVGGWLLTAFLDSGVNWYEYLDGILDRLDVDPER